ncbi:MAG TPA: hypothetical protein VFK89_01520 [Actinomycetota bacterium]|nr:hypothetical protein [Actinomycetota bacterium]
MTDHLVGMLLGTEEDWPRAFESIMAKVPELTYEGETHRFATERITIEPFDLQMQPRHALVIDRLSHWYYVPREWIKKVALMNDVYLMNNPFTFQSMEKHAAYCAMMRLGLNVPDTWLIPYKKPPDNPRFPYTAARYNQPFDLREVAERIGYPLFMKPFDGGAWVGVTRIADETELIRRYDESGERLMHLQASVEGFEVFCRALSIGAETIVMRYDPDQPLHGRYQVDHHFLEPSIGAEVVTIGRLVNAFFLWEFNSCETLIKDDVVYPIDYANACPDISIISLHYYFPWAIKALIKWSIYCTVTGRRMQNDLDTRRYFDVGDRTDLSYGDKLAEYARLSDDHFDTARYHEFCDKYLSFIDELMVEYIDSRAFDDVIVDTVREAFPAHEHDQFIAHYRGLLGAWVNDQRALSS